MGLKNSFEFSNLNTLTLGKINYFHRICVIHALGFVPFPLSFKITPSKINFSFNVSHYLYFDFA